uniref:Uncharacterized protein n=1 Tax=Rhizophora mucronata TaxID=61149 RepID=A0A2P2Q1Q9_RHIMU
MQKLKYDRIPKHPQFKIIRRLSCKSLWNLKT